MASFVVWIGRFFSMDNDFGEHWFDNWDLRKPLEAKAEELGVITSVFTELLTGSLLFYKMI